MAYHSCLVAVWVCTRAREKVSSPPILIQQCNDALWLLRTLIQNLWAGWIWVLGKLKPGFAKLTFPNDRALTAMAIIDICCQYCVYRNGQESWRAHKLTVDQKMKPASTQLSNRHWPMTLFLGKDKRILTCKFVSALMIWVQHSHNWRYSIYYILPCRICHATWPMRCHLGTDGTNRLHVCDVVSITVSCCIDSVVQYWLSTWRTLCSIWPQMVPGAMGAGCMYQISPTVIEIWESGSFGPWEVETDCDKFGRNGNIVIFKNTTMCRHLNKKVHRWICNRHLYSGEHWVREKLRGC